MSVSFVNLFTTGSVDYGFNNVFVFFLKKDMFLLCGIRLILVEVAF